MKSKFIGGLVAAVAVLGLSVSALPAQATEQEKQLNTLAMQIYMNQQAQAAAQAQNPYLTNPALYNQNGYNQYNGYNNNNWGKRGWRNRNINNTPLLSDITPAPYVNNTYNPYLNYNQFNNNGRSGLGNVGRSLLNRFAGY